MLTPLTLLDLKNKALALNPTGRVMPDNAAMVAYQEMVWERILSLCYPLNLALPYNDGGICKIATFEEDIYGNNYNFHGSRSHHQHCYRSRSHHQHCWGTQWYIKAPVIAKSDAEYIDIDSRLKEAFVFYFIAFLSLRAKDNNREEFEARAERICQDYSCDVANMGLAKAKMVYENYSGITGVSFNCQGASYKISTSLIDTIVSCMLCGNVCTSVGESKQMQRYKEYLDYQRKINNGETATFTLLPSHFDALRALDIGLFFYLMNHMELVDKYGLDAVDQITTLSCELGKLMRGEAVADWVKSVDIQLGAEYRSI